MIPERISCPYCNSQVNLTGPLEVGQRIPCPRCGEQFPFHPAQKEKGEASNADQGGRIEEGITNAVPKPFAPGFAIRDPRSATPPTGRWSNRTVAAVLLGGMAVMALLGLVFALMTESVRRAHDKQLPKPESISVPVVLKLGLGVYIVVVLFTCVRALTRRGTGPAVDPTVPAARRFSPASIGAFALTGLVLVVMVLLTGREKAPQSGSETPPNLVRVVPPAELEGLGYLPAGTQVVLGFHAAEAMQTQAAKQFLETVDLTLLEKLTDLKPQDLNHLTAGLGLAKDTAQLTLVMQTRRPYDLKKVEEAIKPIRKTAYGDKPLYAFVWEAPREAVLWCPGDHTLVMTYNIHGPRSPDFQVLPPRPRTGPEKMPPLLRPLFQ
jgi:hypothetical protein